AVEDYFGAARVSERCGNDDPVACPHGAYPCADGEWVALSCWSDAEFAALAKAMGEGALAADARFVSPAARRENKEAIDALIAGWTQGRGAEEAAECLQARGVAS